MQPPHSDHRVLATASAERRLNYGPNVRRMATYPEPSGMCHFNLTEPSTEHVIPVA